MLSNELLLDLFEYYDFYSLFFSFSLINTRFDALSTRCRASIDLDYISPNAFTHFLAHIIPQIHYRIQSLRASNIHQMFILANDDSLFHFARIRSLRLYNIPPNIVHIMVERVHFYQLEHVSLDQNPTLYHPGCYPSKHFLNSNRYPCLRTYSDSFKWLLDGTTVLSSLEYVRMDGGSSSGNFLNLLRRSPHLKSFQAQFWLEPYEYLSSSSSVYTHDVLTNLHLKLGWDFHMPTIIYLFKSTPRVRKLTFSASKNRHYTVVNPNWWESVLSEYLPELKRLYLQVSSQNNDSPHNPEWPIDLDEHTVRQEIDESSYWRSHTWQLTYEKQTPTTEHNYHRAAFSVA